MRQSNSAAAPRESDHRRTGFDALGLRPELLRAVRELDFAKPTPIQADAIPPALAGRDVLACAATGSGKTAAFLLPILHRLSSGAGRGNRVLVLAPTRELAAQIEDHCTQLARHTGIRCAAVFGGVGMAPQENAFRRGVEVIVATPGRLLDHLARGTADLRGIEVLVLDEADRMLDMGFLPDIRRVLGHLPAAGRQTMLFSATLPAPIVELARELLSDPARVNVERRQAPPRTVAQAVYPVPHELKVDLLMELLRRREIGNVIVFCRTKHRSNRLADKLARRGVEVARIHGNRSQRQRTDALEGFKSGRYRVLVATDIVARGIDVEALDHVLNFDVPNAPEDYIHRVGRTGRAELTGEAYTFVSPDEEPLVRAIERAVGQRIERRVLEDFDYGARNEEPLEIPLAQRIAEIRARKAEERARAKVNAERRAAAQARAAENSGSRPDHRLSGGGSGRAGAGRGLGTEAGERASAGPAGSSRRRRRRPRGRPRHNAA